MNPKKHPSPSPTPSPRGKGVRSSFRLPSWSAYLLIPVAIAAAAILLTRRETELLLRAQELNLWLPTHLFWTERMTYPGGLASWLGCYLTQFFYYPWLGTAILAALWIAICAILAWVYRLRGTTSWLTLLVPMALLACLVQTGYWIYYQKLQGHFFVPTVGVLFATLCLAVQRLLDLNLPARTARWARLGWMAIVCIVGYPFFGAWALGATGLLITSPLPPLQGESGVNTSEDQENNRHWRKRLLPSLFGKEAGGSTWSGLGARLLLAITLIAAFPQVCYQHLFQMTERAHLYTAALPSMRYGKDSFEQYRLPYYAIIIAFIILIVASILAARRASKTQPQASKPHPQTSKAHPQASKADPQAPQTHPAEGPVRGGSSAATPPPTPPATPPTRPAPPAPSLAATLAIVAILLLAAIGVNAAWYHDPNFQKELAMYRAIEECDWERALTYARDGSSGVAPTRQIVMYKNLALFRLGRAGDEMFTYPEGATQQAAPWRIHMTQVGGKLIYYHYGKENFCYRWCMEDGVEFGWKAETFKFMARTSLLNHEWEVARKYIDLLKLTTFHRRWAERYEPLLHDHEGLYLDKLEASVKAGRPLLDEAMQREFAPIMHMMTYPDRLDGDNTLVEMYLLQTFARGNGDDLLFQEMTLICALMMKDIDLFWPRFMRYATLNPGIHMPRYYQEAAYLYGHLEKKVDISRMPFDQSVKDSYERFMKFNAQCGAMTEEQKAVAFRPQFGDTFYYFYFLVRNQKTN